MTNFLKKETLTVTQLNIISDLCLFLNQNLHNHTVHIKMITFCCFSLQCVSITIQYTGLQFLHTQEVQITAKYDQKGYMLNIIYLRKLSTLFFFHNSFFLFLSNSAEILSGCVTRELREPEPGRWGEACCYWQHVQMARSYWCNRLERV